MDTPSRANQIAESVHRRWLTGWNNFPRAECDVATLAEPMESLEELGPAATVTPRGQGRSYGDAALPADHGMALATSGMHRILALDERRGVVRAEAGATLHAIIEQIVPRGWWLPVTPGTRQVTLGGALAANVHGKNHHRVGAIAKFVERFDILTEAGVVECTPDQPPGLFRATLGGFGQTGLIQSATLRLRPLETSWMRTTAVRAQNLEELLAVLAEREPRHEHALCWIDTLAHGKHLGRGIAMFGDHAGIDDLDAARRGAPLARHLPAGRRVPSALCGWVLNGWTNRLFNAAVWRRYGAAQRQELVSLDRWFYPLDGLEGWNRLYGRRGFLQYHLSAPALPSGARCIQETLEHLARRQVGSFVAGLKSMQQDDVLLPFAQAGYTLGMDLGPRSRDLHAVLDELDQIVARHGGRVCLSKDARLPAAMFREMYPEHPRWLETVRQYAPQGRFSSRMARRLGWQAPDS